MSIPFEIRLQNFIGAVLFASDRDLQDKVWRQGTEYLTSIISPDELYCQVFDDNQLDQFIECELDASPLSEDQKIAVRAFRDALVAYDVHPDIPFIDAEVLNDPRWLEVIELAARIIILFPSQD